MGPLLLLAIPAAVAGYIAVQTDQSSPQQPEKPPVTSAVESEEQDDLFDPVKHPTFRKALEIARELNRLIKACQEDPERQKKDIALASDYYRVGIANKRIGNNEKSEKYLTLAKLYLPDFYLAENELGVVFSNQKKYDLAIQAFDHAIALNPDDPKGCPWNNRGLVYEYKGEYPKAIADLSKSIELNHCLSQAHHNLGLLYSDMGDGDKSRAEYLLAAANVEDTDHSADALMDRGDDYEMGGNHAKAIQDFKQAAKLAPKWAKTHYELAKSYHTEGNDKAAIGEYLKTLKYDPNSDWAYDGLGTAYYQTGQAAKAVTSYRKAVALYDKDAVTMTSLAFAELVIGQNQQAAQDSLTGFHLAEAEEFTQYALLGHHIALMRLGKSDDDLKSALKKVALDHWPAPILRLYAGEIGEEETRSAITSMVKGSSTPEERQIEVDFYIAELALQQHDLTKAKPLLVSVASHFNTSLWEPKVAQQELKTLPRRP